MTDNRAIVLELEAKKLDKKVTLPPPFNIVYLFIILLLFFPGFSFR